ncbi:MAG: hypothetical protein ACRDP4_07970 [Nocardioidaceae bacterium]
MPRTIRNIRRKLHNRVSTVLGSANQWPGDPDVDAQMQAESLADLAEKQEAPIDWPSLDAAATEPTDTAEGADT